MDNDERVARARHAQQILEDPLVVGAFADLEATFIRGWREGGAMASPDNRPSEAARESVWQMLRSLMMLRDVFERYIRDGKAALAELERKEKAKTADPYG
jgi:hypothetical protein